MSDSSAPLLDYQGRIMFRCGVCQEPLTPDDMIALGMRLPDRGESAADYCDAELIDSIEHERCTHATRRAG